jgi:hypothetical protein
MKATEIAELLPKKIREEIGLVALQPYEVVKFKSLKKPSVRKNTLGDDVFIYSNLVIPKSDKVYLPVEVTQKTDDGEVTTVEVKEFEMEYAVNTSHELVLFEANSQAEIRITGKEASKKELLWYLRLSNFNATNPYKRSDVVAAFEELEPQQEAKVSIEKEAEIAKMVAHIVNMSTQEIDAAYAAVGLAGHDGAVEKQSALIAYIKDDKKRSIFNRLALRKTDITAELIKRALEVGAIVYNDDTRVFAKSYKTNAGVLKVKELHIANQGRDPYDDFCKWLSSKENQSEYNAIHKAVDLALKPVSATV